MPISTCAARPRRRPRECVETQRIVLFGDRRGPDHERSQDAGREDADGFPRTEAARTRYKRRLRAAAVRLRVRSLLGDRRVGTRPADRFRISVRSAERPADDDPLDSAQEYRYTPGTGSRGAREVSADTSTGTATALRSSARPFPTVRTSPSFRRSCSVPGKFTSRGSSIASIRCSAPDGIPAPGA